jgi:hypothetical protein
LNFVSTPIGERQKINKCPVLFNTRKDEKKLGLSCAKLRLNFTLLALLVKQL